MESEFFSCTSWQEIGILVAEFLNVEFKVDIADISLGDKFDSVEIDYKNGTMEVFNKIEDFSDGVRVTDYELVSTIDLELVVKGN